MTKMVKAWIEDFAALGEPSVDALDSGEGCALFPMGKKVVRVLGNILGNTVRVVRHHWRLKVHLRKPARESDDRGAALLEALGDWLSSVSGFQLEMENARLVAQSGDMARYEADLYMEMLE